MKEKTKKPVILTGYFKEESYGLLGPQMAATIINDHTDFKAIVVGGTNVDSRQNLKTALNLYFKDQQKIIGFSTLGRRPDLFDLAKGLKEEGANHGFIHPTPWDSPKISREINKTISMYQLSYDILTNHSAPLIIHHASGLADWIRQIEVKENIEFERVGTTIGRWQTKDKVLL